jgi:hypothetical protein
MGAGCAWPYCSTIQYHYHTYVGEQATHVSWAKFGLLLQYNASLTVCMCVPVRARVCMYVRACTCSRAYNGHLIGKC